MKKVIIVLAAVLALASAGCNRRDVIRFDGENAVGFKFYLFAELNGEKFQGNGDALIVADQWFKFRVYDNLLSKLILYYRSDSDGTNRALLVFDGADYRTKDTTLSRIFTHYFYALFMKNPPVSEDPLQPDITTDGAWIDSLKFDYGIHKYELKVLKRFDSGLPRRISIRSGESSVIFDITQFQSYDFPEPNGDFVVMDYEYEKAFFDWLGEAYANQ